MNAGESKKHLKAIGLFNEDEYKQSEQYQKMKERYEKQKDTIDKDKMKAYKKNHYENNKGTINGKNRKNSMCMW